jgi:hypothetical protein
MAETKIDDEDLLWLMEQNHNAYLAWIAVWLVCMLGITQILTSVLSQAASYNSYYLVLVSILNVGSMFSAWRLINIAKDHIEWAGRLSWEKEQLKKEIICKRGILSEFFVDREGKIRKINRSLILLYFIFPLIFLHLIFLHISLSPFQFDFHFILSLIMDFAFWLDFFFWLGFSLSN